MIIFLQDQVTPKNYGRYVSTGLPVGWVVLDPKSGVIDPAPVDMLKEVATQFKHKIVFTWLDK